MFLGQITAKPSFLNYLFAKKRFHSRFTVPGPTARRSRRSRRSSNKDMPRYTLISRRAHARNANTNTKHDFPVGGVTKDSPPPTSDSAASLLLLRLLVLRCLLLSLLVAANVNRNDHLRGSNLTFSRSMTGRIVGLHGADANKAARVRSGIVAGLEKPSTESPFTGSSMP